jgi:hypothetical protein
MMVLGLETCSMLRNVLQFLSHVFEDASYLNYRSQVMPKEHLSQRNTTTTDTNGIEALSVELR